MDGLGEPNEVEAERVEGALGLGEFVGVAFTLSVVSDRAQVKALQMIDPAEVDHFDHQDASAGER